MLDASAGGAGGRVFGLPRGKEKGAGCGGGVSRVTGTGGISRSGSRGEEGLVGWWFTPG